MGVAGGIALIVVADYLALALNGGCAKCTPFCAFIVIALVAALCVRPALGGRWALLICLVAFVLQEMFIMAFVLAPK